LRKAGLAILIIALILSPVLGTLTIDPSSIKAVQSNRSTIEFSVTFIPGPGEQDKIITLNADWPNRGELSWTEKKLLVGMRAATKLRVSPKTPGEYVLKVSVAGEGILPLEEYATVSIEPAADTESLLSEISSYKARLASLGKKMTGIGSPELLSRFDDLNQTLFATEQNFYDGKYSFARTGLSIISTDLPGLESDVDRTRASRGFFTRALPFLPEDIESVSIDLVILILILLVFIYFAAKAFLF
jgi:hypothetical protein